MTCRIDLPGEGLGDALSRGALDLGSAGAPERSLFAASGRTSMSRDEADLREDHGLSRPGST